MKRPSPRRAPEPPRLGICLCRCGGAQLVYDRLTLHLRKEELFTLAQLTRRAAQALTEAPLVDAPGLEEGEESWH